MRPFSLPEVSVVMSDSAIAACGVPPETRVAPPIVMSIVSSAPTVTVTLPSFESWSISTSRWSSRSFGLSPVTSSAVIAAVSWVICEPIAFTCEIVSVTFWPICDCTV